MSRSRRLCTQKNCQMSVTHPQPALPHTHKHTQMYKCQFVDGVESKSREKA